MNKIMLVVFTLGIIFFIAFLILLFSQEVSYDNSMVSVYRSGDQIIVPVVQSDKTVLFNSFPANNTVVKYHSTIGEADYIKKENGKTIIYILRSKIK